MDQAKDQSNAKNRNSSQNFVFGVILGLTLAIVQMSRPELALACEMTSEELNEIYINPELNFLHYGSSSKSAGPITTEILNCRKSEGKYLMFSLGIKKARLISDVSHISYDGRGTSDRQCMIKNADSVFSNLGSLEKEFELSLQKQFKALRSCVYFRVRDINNELIQFNSKQAACLISPGPDGTLALDGNFCFLRVNSRAHLQLAVEVKQECRNPGFLVKNGISAQDLNIVANAWIAGDDTGSSPDLEYLRSIPIKLSLLPSRKVLPLAENNIKEEIKYPSLYSLSLNAGPIGFQKVGAGRYNFDFALAVNSYSPEKCVTGVPCSGPSNFNLPVAGEIQLFEMTGEGPELVRSFPFLAVAPPQFQGILKNSYRPVIEDFEFKSGVKYQVTFTMTDPAEDFQRAQIKTNAIKFELPRSKETLPNIQATPTMGHLRELMVMDSLPSGMTPRTVDSALSEFNRILKDGKTTVQWPLAFETLCSQKTPFRCSDLSSVSDVFVVSVEFQAGSLNSDTNFLEMSHFTLGGHSAIGPLMTGAVKELPRYDCNMN